jgi:hypothetical protein
MFRTIYYKCLIDEVHLHKKLGLDLVVEESEARCLYYTKLFFKKIQ